jgi:hypothetical protein
LAVPEDRANHRASLLAQIAERDATLTASFRIGVECSEVPA